MSARFDLVSVGKATKEQVLTEMSGEQDISDWGHECHRRVQARNLRTELLMMRGRTGLYEGMSAARILDRLLEMLIEGIHER